MNYQIRCVVGTIATVFFIGFAHAASDVKRDTDKDVIWQAGVDGVEIEWDSDGTFKRIYSMFYQPVNFPDRRGINKSQIIAEEKAKAAIVRFMDQEVSSKRFVEQVDKDIETAARSQSEAGDNWNKENHRLMTESLTELTQSSASGRLRGVIALEKGYDEARQEAWVKVGISKKSMLAAQGLSEAVAANKSSETKSASNETSSRQSNLRQASEVRRSNQADW